MLRSENYITFVLNLHNLYGITVFYIISRVPLAVIAVVVVFGVRAGKLYHGIVVFDNLQV